MKKEIISYLFFGVLTTIVNFAAYLLLTDILIVHYTIATVASWFIAVLFAFITNKIYVFKSKGSMQSMAKELTSFIFFRVLSLGIDLGLMIIFVSALKFDDLTSKIAVNIVIVIINYVLSKFVIFTKHNPSSMEGSRRD
jgi:putative flippase GtrA